VYPKGSAAIDAVRVRAPARLHFGFLDLNGSLGRRFGSLGLTLENPMTEILVLRVRDGSAAVKENERIARIVRAASSFLKVSGGVDVRVEAEIPSHAGFGSGTQLALAIVTGMARLLGRPLDLRKAAGALDRGNRSGVGLAAFSLGGFILDGGRDQSCEPPPVLSRMDFPEAWRVLLIIDNRESGIHGTAEAAAFRDLPVFPEAEAARLCRVAVMQILPALALGDIGPFGRGIAEIQRRLGDHFAPFQGGGRFTSPAVAAALARLESMGIEGVGQSSWGPTGFAILGSEDDARRVANELRRDADEHLRFLVTRGCNRGAEIIDLDRCAREVRHIR
jgi:beta-RFAP synthase